MHIGIVGDGQLARMLAQAALRVGHNVSVTSNSTPTSAAIKGVNVLTYAQEDAYGIRRLLAAGPAVITIENEFLPIDALIQALHAHPSVRFLPSPQSIATAQDKLRQKSLFAELQIRTADFVVLDESNLEASFGLLAKRFPSGAMLKWSRYGYDGKGNLRWHPDEADKDLVRAFVEEACARGAKVYGEQLIAFEHELAMVATRAKDGSFIHFPLVYSVQENSVCREVFGPAAAMGADPQLESQAQIILRRIAEHLGFVGTLAVEFFVDERGALLANEMAPRVHNSGHYSLFGTEQSQFDAHVQAITDAQLKPPTTKALVLMRNLLGPAGRARSVNCPAPRRQPPEGCELHWYDKGGASEGRKMGHLTGRAGSPNELSRLRAQMADYEAQYWADLENNAM